MQLLEPRAAQGVAAEVTREGSTAVRRAPIAEERSRDGRVTVRYLARGDADDASTVGAETYTPMTIAHVELNGEGASHTLPLPEGWTCLVYVRKGAVGLGGGAAAERPGALPGVAEMHEMAYLPRTGGECLELTNAVSGGQTTDVLVLSGRPIGAPVVASGTMVMNSDLQVRQAMGDYQRGNFGIPWEHTLDDDEWAAQCDRRFASRTESRSSQE